MRMLGIDYGTKRVGLAISDELGIAARGIGVVYRRSDRQCLEEIARVVGEYHVGRIVVGYPVRTDGTIGVECERVERFTDLIRGRLPLPVVKWDETLTTCEAEDILKEKGMSWQKRKRHIDELAAVLILQGYLDHSPPVNHDCPLRPDLT